MQRGFGVSVVVSELVGRLRAVGVGAVAGALEIDGDFEAPSVSRVSAEAEAVASLAERHDCHTIVAQTSPFFELLPELAARFDCWAWEHGDPTPAFFDADREARRQVIDNKRRHVYPAVTGVIASSEFLRFDVGWDACSVVHLAADHAPDRGCKPLTAWLPRDGRRLRVGTLMRLGVGEAKYKGNQLFRQIKTVCDRAGLGCDFSVMGRGRPSDAASFQKEGIEAHLSASDEQKWEYLRGLDVFISCSLWEGFNLPLAEAQALGTVGLAFDVGAHPEVTPFVMGGVADVVRQLRAYLGDSDLLRRHSSVAYRFVRSRFSWRLATQRLLEAVAGRTARDHEA